MAHSRLLLLCLVLISVPSALCYLSTPLVTGRGSGLAIKMQSGEHTTTGRRALLQSIPAALAASVLFGKDANAEARSGAELFYRRCIECHGGGMNSIVPEKSLMKEALQKYDRYNKEAIVKIATEGAGEMPKFLGMVVDGRPYTPEELENAADFILQNAESDWKKFGLR
mmetsp:Transcript_52280/g.104715  ORF Transcript_52280/g.104715 Transcript_52280/m.104715 type:complete len:169 (+) Transcript_52280:36-542(+)